MSKINSLLRKKKQQKKKEKWNITFRADEGNTDVLISTFPKNQEAKRIVKLKLAKRWRAETTKECDEEEGEEEDIFVSTEVQSSRWIDRKCFHNIAFLYTRIILCILLIINFRLSHSESCPRSLVWNKKFTTPKRNVKKISVLLNFKCEIQRETLSKRWYQQCQND